MQVFSTFLIYSTVIILTFTSCVGQEKTNAVQVGNVVKPITIKNQNSTDLKVKLLMRFYKDIDTIKENHIFFKDGKSIIYNDNKEKNIEGLLKYPDIEDQYHYLYNLSNDNSLNTDAGRIRNEDFFKRIYGSSSAEVQKNLVSIVWCPSFVNQRIQVTKKCGVADSLKKVSLALDKHPEWKKYLTAVGGTFNWRKISGTSRLSAHSFGMTIDINSSHSNYWQWDCSCIDETKKLSYRNSIPLEIVEIFEKYGFIWGGKWLHYDTMHFEFRPELTKYNNNQ